MSLHCSRHIVCCDLREPVLLCRRLLIGVGWLAMNKAFCCVLSWKKKKHFTLIMKSDRKFVSNSSCDETLISAKQMSKHCLNDYYLKKKKKNAKKKVMEAHPEWLSRKNIICYINHDWRFLCFSLKFASRVSLQTDTAASASKQIVRKKENSGFLCCQQSGRQTASVWDAASDLWPQQ